jgi:hypothetical protein
MDRMLLEGKMPIDLVWRPRPIFAQGRHPCIAVAEVPTANFEELLDDVDIVVTNFPYSRVVFAALNSTTPIIYLDRGNKAFIDLSYDDRGLPQVRPQALADAIFGAQLADVDLIGRFGTRFAWESQGGG